MLQQTSLCAIITSTYRYKRPPQKQKAVLLEGPVVVGIAPTSPQSCAPKPPAPANDDRTPAIVTAAKRWAPTKPETEIDPPLVRGWRSPDPHGWSDRPATERSRVHPLRQIM